MISAQLQERRWRFSAVALTCAALVLSACSGSSGTTGDGDTETLTVALPTFEADSPFVWEANALGRPPYAAAIETLVQEDPETGEYGPGLAESWSPSKDFTTWTFKLREGVQFHRGWGELTSEDVVYNFERGQEEGATGAMAQFWLLYVDSVEAPSPYTFVVNFKAPMFTPWFMAAFAGQVGINSKKYVEEVGDEEARREPVGTGPYEFVSGETGTEYRYKAVKDHYRVVPDFENLIVRKVADATTIASAILAGEIDAAMVSGNSISTLEDRAKLFEQEDGVPNWMVFPETEPAGTPQHNPDLPWNPSNPDDPADVENARKVREAMNLAFDKSAVVDSVWKGRASLDKAFGWYVQPWHSAHREDSPPVPGYDPDRAKELLKEAGYEDGFTFPVVISQLQPDSEAILPAFAQDLAKVGIDVEVSTMEHATLVGNLRAKKLKHAFIYATPGRNDQSLMVSSVSEASVFRFLNTFPDLWDESKAAGLSAERQDEFIVKVVNRLADDYATIPLGIQSTVVATSDKVADWPLLGGVPVLHNFEYVTAAD